MSNPEPVLWDDEPSSPVGITPYGYYDTDAVFVTEAPKVARFCAYSLGYPTVDVEMVDRQFYACFENSVLEYSSQVNQFNMRENMLSYQGISTGSSITQKYIASNPLPNLVTLAQNYGTEAVAGGDVTLKRGYLTTTASVQTYDLTQWANVSESGQRIEIRRVFYENSPAISRYYDPYATTGIGFTNLIGEFGFDGFSPAASFCLMPIYEDVLRLQGIELNDSIRKNIFSFQLVNNQIRLFPIPLNSYRIYFDYYVVNDKFTSITSGSNGSGSSNDKASDYSNVPFTNIPYQNINAVGRQWIFKYTLALVKDLLGNIRSKYDTIPIPDAEFRLNGSDLIQQSQQEKEQLMTQLRETLEQTGKKAQLDKEKENAQSMQEIFQKVPLTIYIA